MELLLFLFLVRGGAFVTEEGIKCNGNSLSSSPCHETMVIAWEHWDPEKNKKHNLEKEI